MDTSLVKLIPIIVNETLRTSPTSGNGYGIALASVTIVAFAFGAIYFLDRHKANKRVDQLQKSRETARTKFEDLIKREFNELRDDHKDTIKSLRDELLATSQGHGNRIGDIDQRLSRLEGEFQAYKNRN